MATTPPKADRSPARDGRAHESDAVVQEVIDALLEPDRAHHDEIGRTAEAAVRTGDHNSPREQPAAPLDVEHAAGE